MQSTSTTANIPIGNRLVDGIYEDLVRAVCGGSDHRDVDLLARSVRDASGKSGEKRLSVAKHPSKPTRASEVDFAPVLPLLWRPSDVKSRRMDERDKVTTSFQSANANVRELNSQRSEKSVESPAGDHNDKWSSYCWRAPVEGTRSHTGSLPKQKTVNCSYGSNPPIKRRRTKTTSKNAVVRKPSNNLMTEPTPSEETMFITPMDVKVVKSSASIVHTIDLTEDDDMLSDVTIDEAPVEAKKMDTVRKRGKKQEDTLKSPSHSAASNTEIDASEVPKTRLVHLVSEILEEKCRHGEPVTIYDITELMRKKYQIALKVGITQLIIQTDYVRVASNCYVPFSDSDENAIRFGKAAVAKLQEERLRRDQFATVLRQTAERTPVVKFTHLRTNYRERYKTNLEDTYIKHLLRKHGYSFQRNYKGWSRRQTDNAGEQHGNQDSEIGADTLEEAVDNVTGLLQSKQVATTIDAVRSELRNQVSSEPILRNDRFIRAIIENAKSSSKRASLWVINWILNEVLRQLFANGRTAPVSTQELHMRTSCLKLLVSANQLMYHKFDLDDFYMKKGGWIPIDDEFRDLLSRLDTEVERLFSREQHVTRAALEHCVSACGVSDKYSIKLAERLGCRFCHNSRSYVRTKHL